VVEGVAEEGAVVGSVLRRGGTWVVAARVVVRCGAWRVVVAAGGCGCYPLAGLAELLTHGTVAIAYAVHVTQGCGIHGCAGRSSLE